MIKFFALATTLLILSGCMTHEQQLLQIHIAARNAAKKKKLTCYNFTSRSQPKYSGRYCLEYVGGIEL